MLLATIDGLPTGKAIGLLVVALVFIAFALASAFVVPARKADFPGKGRNLHLLLSGGLMVAMLLAVVFLASEPKEGAKASGEPPATETQPVEPPATPPPAQSSTASETTTTTPETTAPAETTTPSGGGSGDPAAGKKIFASAGCVGCHTLADAGATGSAGPNLDQVKPALDLIVDRVTNGLGAMPPFKGQLDEQQIADVAAYVYDATH